MDLEGIMLSEISQMEKDKYCMISLQCEILNKQTITRDKEEHYIMIKGSIQEEDITIVNIYAPNIGAPQ